MSLPIAYEDMSPLQRAQDFELRNAELRVSIQDSLQQQGWNRIDAIEEVDIRFNKLLRKEEVALLPNLSK
jgi:hypothetical protein